MAVAHIHRDPGADRVTPLRTAAPLPARLADDLRRRIASGEWPETARIPSEAELAAAYAVSRATVRAALERLAADGLVRTRHGVGTFVTAFGSALRAGIAELRSITETIAEQGHEPGMEYRRRRRRPAGAEEADRLALAPGTPVFALERAILSDGEVVAFSYDTIDAAAFPPGTDAASFTGSLFAALEAAGARPDRAIARLHAVRSRSIGWAPHRPRDGLYLLLDQLHLAGDRPVHWSRTYFIEGRYEFTIVRR